MNSYGKAPHALCDLGAVRRSPPSTTADCNIRFKAEIEICTYKKKIPKVFKERNSLNLKLIKKRIFKDEKLIFVSFFLLRLSFAREGIELLVETKSQQLFGKAQNNNNMK